MAFGNQMVNTTSASQSVTLTNSGNAPLTITSVTLGGTNPGDFTPANQCPLSPSTLAAGASCTISATFTPAALGSRSATLSIADNASGSPHTLALCGNACAPSAIFSSNTLNFGTQTINTTSPS